MAYLNVDVSVAGSRWSAEGSPSLAHLIKRTALEVPHPTIKGKALWDARNDDGPFGGIEFSNMTVDAELMEAYTASKLESESFNIGISPLGSGSDYTVFLQRLGVCFVSSYTERPSMFSSRLRVLIKDSGSPRRMLSTITIQSMTLNVSKRSTLILVSIAMYAVYLVASRLRLITPCSRLLWLSTLVCWRSDSPIRLLSR